MDLEESILGRIEPDELALQIEAPTVIDDGSPRLTQAVELQREDQERRQSLWRWLLAAALALFTLETVISNWVSRRATGAAGALVG